MNCPRCGQYVPDNKLVCESCTRLRSDKAFAESQAEHIRLVLHEGLKLILRGTPKHWHIEMFGGSNLSFCFISTRGRQRLLMPFDQLLKEQNICLACREQLAKAMEHVSAV